MSPGPPSLRYPLHGASPDAPGGCYRRPRDTEPVARVVLPSGDEAWMVTRYEDARTVLSDPGFSNDLSYDGAPRLTTAGNFAGPGSIMNMDPPEHTRLRRLIGKAFTARRVETLRGRIERTADELLDALGAGPRPADLIEAYASPLPMRVIGELLGVPGHDRSRFREWSSVIVALGEHTADEIMAAHRAGRGQIETLIAAKRRDPGDDLLSALIQARDEGRVLTESELVGLAFALVVAGHETTVSLIGTGVVQLLRHPGQLAALRADPALLPSAVEEILRYDGPVEQAMFRVTTREVELGGVTIPAGEAVMAVVPSANHDERRFTGPASFDITRADNQHLGFGHGPHFCPGAGLARLETQVALGRLLDRFPALRLAVPADELGWRHLSTRGPRRLPVTW